MASSTSKKKLLALLERGYFPIQLPPPFTTASLANESSALLGAGKLPAAFPSECETFSIARVGHRRRTLRIPNPISQLLLCRVVADHWPALSRHFRRSPLSLSVPKIDLSNAKRAIDIPKFGQLESERVSRSAGYRYALISDIAQFFPSLYTHSVSWALHGKMAIKAALRARPRNRIGFGEDLDLHARNCQSQQTIGVPIGPDSSHILAEVVAVGVDRHLRESLTRWPAGYRYIDDFVLFFLSRPEADEALSSLNQALEHYELRQNEQKTKIVTLESLEVDTWVHELRHFDFSHTKSRQAQEIHHFFQLAFSLGSKYPGESVMKFALHRVATELVRQENWPQLQSYLLRVAHTYPETLQLVSQFLATYRSVGYLIDKKVLARALESLLGEHLRSAHHGEIAWALWIAIDNQVALKQKLVEGVVKVQSSVCALLALHMRDLALVKGRLSVSKWQARCNANSLANPDWLLAYQAERDGLFPGHPKYVSGFPGFGELLSRRVTFYDRTPPLHHLFSLKIPPESSLDAADILSLEGNPNEFLEFADVDEEYIDSV